ncbi:MAG: hypothetical protein AAFZ52_18640, partial [Bacteroidota bacterium]
EDQRPWCPEFNGDVKVSSLQTGVFSGPLHSPLGQHQISPSCQVRQEQKTERVYTPQYGYFEIRARAIKSINTRRTVTPSAVRAWQTVPKVSSSSTPVAKRKPSNRGSRIIRAIEDGNFVFAHAYQDFDHGTAKWTITDWFDTAENDLIFENCDNLEPIPPREEWANTDKF